MTKAEGIVATLLEDNLMEYGLGEFEPDRPNTPHMRWRMGGVKPDLGKMKFTGKRGVTPKKKKAPKEEEESSSED